MIRINGIHLPVDAEQGQLEKKIRKTLKLDQKADFSYEIIKKSIDARKKPNIFYVYSVYVKVSKETQVLKRVSDKNVTQVPVKHYQFPATNPKKPLIPPVVIGAGPAGLFCAYALASMGQAPIVLERGKPVEERQQDVEQFWETGVLNTASNVQFGEGGAGTFSDGKLNTLVKDPVGRNRFVLETFVKFGAPKNILYENKPHIGTDILQEVVKNMRNAILALGGSIRFEECVTDFRMQNGAIHSIEVNHKDWMEVHQVVLALGHSARDTFETLYKRKVPMEAKAFAVGFRVEHPQKLINENQYGAACENQLPAAPYKLTCNLENGRGVYSFCMCPGGYVVNASSEEGRLAVNGMSYSKRDSQTANSAIIVSIAPKDFEGSDALAGIRFQEQLEKRAYELAKGAIPQQLFGDYEKNQCSRAYGTIQTCTKGAHELCNLRGLLPEELEESFLAGMHSFAREIKGYDAFDVVMSGIESRTSSPVRIWRKEDFQSEIAGLYPCGEGAGYAGGIMSAAMDGLKTAEKICGLIPEN